MSTNQGTNSTNFKYQQSNQVGATVYTGVPSLTFTSQSTPTFIYQNAYNVVHGAPTVIDLGNLTDAFGEAITWTHITSLMIVNNDTTNNLSVGGGSNAVFTLLPFTLNGQTASQGNDGSNLVINTPIAVSASPCNLQLTSSASTISVNCYFVGS